MNISELAESFHTFVVYGVQIEGLEIKPNPAAEGEEQLTPVLLKGWSYRDACFLVREGRILLLPGNGKEAKGCGWLKPVRMWRLPKNKATIALDIRAGSLEALLAGKTPTELFDGPTAAATSSPIHRKNEQDIGLKVDPAVAQKFAELLNDDTLINAAWAAHNSNNEL